MTNEQCKAITPKGKHCSLKPGKSGYCHIHDPEKIAARQAAQKQAEEGRKRAWAKGEKLREVIEVVKRVCKAKGWLSEVMSQDSDNWKYASVSVGRYVPAHFGGEKITGVFDVSIDNGVKISLQTTSFLGHGLKDLHDAIMSELGTLRWLEPRKKIAEDKTTIAFHKLEDLLKRFHHVAKQLGHRHDKRDTLVIKDEYDVQDLLHVVLKTAFDDVRPEEYTPTYAGASSRMDFLLKQEKIVVEAKMASSKLPDKLIGEQLIVDISRYQSHPDCQRLVCFVYDPGGFIRNPVALESDLSGKHNRLDVHVLVVPH
jgi:hypothetical protein